MALKIANKCGMGITKPPLGTMSVLSGLNANVTDGVAIRTAAIPISQIVFVPISNILSQCQARCQMTCLELDLKIQLLCLQNQVAGLERLTTREQAQRK